MIAQPAEHFLPAERAVRAGLGRGMNQHLPELRVYYLGSRFLPFTKTSIESGRGLM